ncbi:MAG: CHAT domain-containing protein [Bacteroidia bacterium]|nr:CHAT domain-containing protein [Bacteroidia bacterium]
MEDLNCKILFIAVLLWFPLGGAANPMEDQVRQKLDKGWRHLEEFRPDSALLIAENQQAIYDNYKLKDDSLQSEIFHLRGRAAFDAAEWEESQSYLKAALGLNPLNAKAWRDWALMAYREADYEQAFKRLEKALTHAEDASSIQKEIKLEIARLGIETGKLGKASLLESLGSDPKDKLNHLKYVFLKSELDKLTGKIDILNQPFEEIIPYTKAEIEAFQPIERYYYRLVEAIWLKNSSLPFHSFKAFDIVRPVVEQTYFPAHLKGFFWERQFYNGLVFLASDSLLVFLNKSETAYQKAYGSGHLATLELAMKRAFFYWEVGKLPQLIQLMDEYEAIILAANIPDHNALPYIWRLKSLAYRDLGDVDRAILLMEKAIYVMEKKYPGGHKELAGFYNSLASAYDTNYTEEYLNKAIGIYTKAIKLEESFFGKDSPGLARLYNNMAYDYLQTGRQEEGIAAFEKAYELAIKGFGKENLKVAKITHGLSKAYRESGRIKEAIDIGKVGYDIYKKISMPGETYMVSSSLVMGNAFFEAGMFDSCYHYLHEAYNGYFPNVDIENLEDLTLPENFVMYDLESVSAILGTLGTYYREINELEKSRISFKTVIDWRTRYEIRASNSLMAGLRSTDYLFNYAKLQEVDHQLYLKTGNPIYLEEAFAFSDRSKTNSLRFQLQGNRAFKFAGISPAKLSQGKRLFSTYEKSEQEFLQLKDAGAEKEDLLSHEIELKGKRQQYLEWEKDVEKANPRYYQLKYDQHLVFPDEVRDKLQQENTLVVEYFWFENQMMYIHAFDDKDIVMVIDTLRGRLEGQIDSLAQMLGSTQNAENKSFDPTFFKTYVKLSSELYQRLLGQIIDSFEDKKYERLLIIPDQKLAKLNFDILLTEQKTYDHPTYQDLPYLLKKYNIRYDYAASLMGEESFQQETPRYSYLGLAPVFSKNYRARLSASQDLEYYESRLKYNQLEVQNVHDLLGGQAFKGEMAIEKRAKEYIEEASILHFATHTLLNDSLPMYTSLVLHEESDSTEDGFLHAYEIYPKELKADLAVLSACETGLGKWHAGEGMMSLARAFKYAGCSNIVMSLWRADDQATSEIITDFFALVKKGYPKDEALRKAKLQFLEKGHGKQFPHYWGTFVLIGDDQEVQLKKSLFDSVNLKLLLGATFFLILGIWILSRKRQ